MEDKFFANIQQIQNRLIEIMAIKSNIYDDTQELIIDTTYETIYALLELIDGYGPDKNKYDLINANNGVIINKDVNLHDKCEDYLKFTNK